MKPKRETSTRSARFTYKQTEKNTPKLNTSTQTLSRGWGVGAGWVVSWRVAVCTLIYLEETADDTLSSTLAAPQRPAVAGSQDPTAVFIILLA